MGDFLLVTVFAYPLLQAWGTGIVALFWVAGRLFSQRIRSVIFVLGGLVAGGLLFWGWHSLPADTKTFFDLAYSTLLFLVSVGMLLIVLPRFVAVRRERGQVVAGATRPGVWTALIALAGFFFFMSGVVLLDHVLVAVAAGSRPDSWNAALTTFELLLEADLIFMLSLIFMRQVSVRGVLVRLTFYPWKILNNVQVNGNQILVEAPSRNRVFSKNPVSKAYPILLHMQSSEQEKIGTYFQKHIAQSSITDQAEPVEGDFTR